MLEGIGLLLAIVDFFDLTPKLEAFLDRLRGTFETAATYFRTLVIRSENELQQKDKGQEIFGLTVFTVICGLPAVLAALFFVYFTWVNYTQGKPSGLIVAGRKAFGIVEAGGIGEFLLGLLLAPFLFVTVAVMMGFALVLSSTAVYYFILWPLRVGLLLMDKAPRGMVGSIGLLLAIVGFVVRIY